MEKRKVLVSGATGQQGGAVVQALLNDGHHVIGFTRNPDSTKAKNLISQGVEMKEGDFLNSEDVLETMKSVNTVFAMTTPFEKGVEAETKQGIAFANIAKEANIGHFIYSSVADANKSTGIPHFDSKYKVEEHIVSIGIPYTIVAPVYFMENIFFPWTLDPLKQGKLTAAIPADRALQQIAVEDIGKFVAELVNRREEMFGKRIDIAGDEISGGDCARILSEVTGKSIKYEGFSPDYLRAQSEDMALMYEWFDKTGYSIDLEELKKYHFSSFELWAKKQDWSILN